MYSPPKSPPKAPVTDDAKGISQALAELKLEDKARNQYSNVSTPEQPKRELPTQPPSLFPKDKSPAGPTTSKAKKRLFSTTEEPTPIDQNKKQASPTRLAQ